MRALAARSRMDDPDNQTVLRLPIRPHGRLVLTGARAGRQVAVVIEVDIDDLATAPIHALTPRERATVELLVQGLPAKRIAAQLHISVWTVRDHMKSIYAKAGVTNRGELAALIHNASRSPPETQREAGTSGRPQPAITQPTRSAARAPPLTSKQIAHSLNTCDARIRHQRDSPLADGRERR